MTISPDGLYSVHLSLSVLVAAAIALLGMMFWNASLTSAHSFTRLFLRLLSVKAVVRVVSVGASMYRASQIEPEHVATVAVVVGLLGLTLELLWYVVMIWFMLRPQTKKALNGATRV